MRYRIGETPGDLGAPVEQAFYGAGIFGLLLGFGFVIAGVRGRHLWLALWGGMLSLASLLYVGFTAVGIG